MTDGRLRAAARGTLEGVASLLSRPLPAGDLQAPAIVFAPHQDDETLGCGGLIALKRAQGVAVSVVFMTDGRTSHARWLDGDELARRRRAEAVAACGALGVAEADVHFLGFRDGELSNNLEAATERVAQLLREQPGRVLLAPYAHDVTPDHLATLAAVTGAAASLPPGPAWTLLEYPVWFWHHWPWVCPLAQRSLLRPRVVLAAVARRCFDLTTHVDVRPSLAAKRAALACHRTQVERQDGHDDWPVLADVARGTWLAAFFTGREHFRRRRLIAGRAAR